MIHRYIATIQNAIHLSNRAFGEYKGRIIILVILAFVSGVFEGIGINALIPLFSLIVGAENSATDPISTYIEAGFQLVGVNFSVPYLLIFISLLFIATSVITIAFSYISLKINAEYEAETRTRLLSATLESSWSYLMKQKLGYLEQVLLTDVVRSKNYLSIISMAVMTLVNLAVYSAVAISISPVITLGTFFLGIVLFLAIRPFIRKIREISVAETNIYKELSHQINEAITGMKTIKAMNVQDRVRRVGVSFFEKVKELQIRLFFVNITSTHLMQPVSLLFIVLVFYFFYQSPTFDFAALLVIIYLIKQIFVYIKRLNTIIIGINANYPFLKNVLDYELLAHDQRESDIEGTPFTLNKSITFENTGFAYAGGSSVLSGLNFSIAKGETVGIIGESGAGKTTLVDILLRLLQPTEGRVCIDGTDIQQISLQEYRNSIGYVSQDIFLFHDTIANNISFFDETITQEDIALAAQQANMYNAIMDCPDGFDTVIGDRGIRLSGGQRQRLSIARVLARKPKLLILDEATSALDNESEAKIRQVIDGLKGEITVIIIAHRLSTVLGSDTIVAIDKGTVIEQGSPKQLLADGTSYLSRMHSILGKNV